MNSKGFTLIELLVAIALAGILAAIALPFFLKWVRETRYAEATAVMRAIATDIQIFRVENERYPRDVVRNTPPEGATIFPIAPETPFGAPYDYDNKQAGDFCWIQVSFFGEDRERQVSQTEFEGELGAIATIGDDRVLVVAADECGEI